MVGPKVAGKELQEAQILFDAMHTLSERLAIKDVDGCVKFCEVVQSHRHKHRDVDKINNLADATSNINLLGMLAGEVPVDLDLLAVLKLQFTSCASLQHVDHVKEPAKDAIKMLGKLASDFVNKLLADHVKTFGSSTLAAVLANKDAEGRKIWVQDAAALIIYAMPPRHRSAITTSAEAWVTETETQAHLVSLMAKLNSLDTTAAMFNKPIQGAGVYPVAPIAGEPTSGNDVATLRAEIAQLRAEAAKAGSNRGRPPIDFSKPWEAKFGPCRTCRDDPQSVGSTGAREHWRKDCPLR